jgi:hypothetical protein
MKQDERKEWFCFTRMNPQIKNPRIMKEKKEKEEEEEGEDIQSTRSFHVTLIQITLHASH